MSCKSRVDIKMPGKMILQLLVLIVALGFASGESAAQNANPDKELKRVAGWMTGNFDTFAQVETDEANDAAYKHIRALVHVAPVSMRGIADGLAFYIENQSSGDRPRPYRQRVYVMKRDQKTGKIIIEMYRIKGDQDFINAYKNPGLLSKLTAELLTREEGCDLVFTKVNDNFYKGAAGENKTCRSNLRGATYMMSHTDLSPTEWVNLDQGFDDAGNSKWGPPPGTIGHIFIKRQIDN